MVHYDEAVAQIEIYAALAQSASGSVQVDETPALRRPQIESKPGDPEENFNGLVEIYLQDSRMDA